MTVVAVIPARGGSKGVPAKNVQVVGSRSLIGRAVLATQMSGEVDSVVVSTDGAAIADEARRFGASVVERPDELAGDTASSESALLHALGVVDLASGDDIVVFVQCSSPFIEPSAIASAVRRVRSGEADVVFAATRSHAFLWAVDQTGAARGINHDHSVRQRRQDRPVEFRETGAFYVMRIAEFRERRHRFFGRVSVEEVSDLHSIEIDTPSDLLVAQRIARFADPLGPNSIDPRRVRALVSDFDGVHTDNTALVSEHGDESAVVNRSDGLGVARARAHGLPFLILSTEANPIVRHRAEKLQVECIHSCDDKLAALEQWSTTHGIPLDAVVYIGNDVNDLPCLQRVGFPVVVADAHPDLLTIPVVVTAAAGGYGAVREVIDRLIPSPLPGKRLQDG